MDPRIKRSLRLLAILFVLSVPLVGAPGQSRPSSGRLYIEVSSGNCMQSRLTWSLSGVNPLPDHVAFKIEAVSTIRGEPDRLVRSGELHLSNGKYEWAGQLLPLGLYRGELFSPGGKVLLGQFVFPNEGLIQELITGERGEIVQLRGGDEDPGAGASSDPDRSSHTVDNLPPRIDGKKLHILLFSSDRGMLADQFYGPAPEDGKWISRPLPHGNYKRVIIEYDQAGGCRVVKRK